MNLKFFPLILIVLLLMACKTKNVQEIVRIRNNARESRLKGPVLLQLSRMPVGSDSLNWSNRNSDKHSAMIIIHGNIGGGGGGEYNRYGQILKTYRMKTQTSFSLDSAIVALRNYYDEKDFDKKVVYTQKDYPNNTFNPLRLIVNRESDFGPADTIGEKVTETKYDYVFGKHGKVIKEEKYNLWDEDGDGIYSDYKGLYIVNYLYDSKSQLMERKFDITNRFEGGVQIDHNYDADNHYKITEKYDYDTSGRLKSVKMYREPYIWFSEEYTYNEDNKVIRMRRIRYSEIQVINKEYRISQEFFFDDYGDL